MDYRDADWIVFHENEEKLLSFPCFLDTLGLAAHDNRKD